MMDNPLRVLVIGPSNIGDAILMSGVVSALRAQASDIHLTLVVGSRALAFFGDDPRVQSLVNLDLFSGASGRLKLAVALWRYRPQIVVDLRNTLYPLLLKPAQLFRYLSRPPKMLVHMRDRQLWKLKRQVPDLREPTSEGALGQMPAPDAVWSSQKDQATVQSLYVRWSLNNAQKLVIICPGSRSHIKRWLSENFAVVADKLISETFAQVVFAGEPEEEPIIESILGAMRKRAHSAVGLTTIRQLGLLMRRCALVITNDSASLHLASAVNVPTIALFGPTDAEKYGPTSTHNQVIRRRLFCAPCEQPNCRYHHECMRFISPEEVFQTAVYLLGVAAG